MNAQAHKEVVSQGPVEVIFRRDAANNRVGFLKQSVNLTDDKILMWTEGGGKETREVPLSYYHATTKLEHPDMLEIQNKFAEQFAPTFGIALKHRLFKNSRDHHSYNGETAKSANNTMRRSNDVKPFDQSEYLAKMSVAITAAVKAALEAVNAEYAPK